MAIDNTGRPRPDALVLGGDRRTQMLAQMLLTELGYAVCVAPTLARIPATASPDRVRALVLIGTASPTAPTRVITGLRQRGYHGPLVVLLHSATPRLRQQ